FYNLVGRAHDHIAAINDVLHFGGGAGGLARVEAGRAADLALDAGALGCLGDVTRRHRPARVDPQAAAVEILGRLGVKLHRLLAGLGDADELQEAGTVRVAVLAEPGHLVPEPGHRRLPVL